MAYKTRYKISYLITIISIIITIIFAIKQYDSIDNQDMQSKINFLQEEKIINTKQFLISKSDISPKNTKDIESSHNQTDKQIDEPKATNNNILNLNAILNNKALINGEWFSLNDILTFDDDLFRVINIQNEHITLKNTANLDIIILNIQNDKNIDSFTLK